MEAYGIEICKQVLQSWFYANGVHVKVDQDILFEPGKLFDCLHIDVVHDVIAFRFRKDAIVSRYLSDDHEAFCAAYYDLNLEKMTHNAVAVYSVPFSQALSEKAIYASPIECENVCSEDDFLKTASASCTNICPSPSTAV